jgi:hypothetical protein
MFWSNHVSAVIMGKIIIRPITMMTMFFWIYYFKTYPTFRFYDYKTFLGYDCSFNLSKSYLYFFSNAYCFSLLTFGLAKGWREIDFYSFSTMLANGAY